YCQPTRTSDGRQSFLKRNQHPIPSEAKRQLSYRPIILTEDKAPHGWPAPDWSPPTDLHFRPQRNRYPSRETSSEALRGLPSAPYLLLQAPQNHRTPRRYSDFESLENTAAKPHVVPPRRAPQAQNRGVPIRYASCDT